MFLNLGTVNCWSCVRWNKITNLYKINFGVRLDSVLSPTLFDIYVNDIVSRLPCSQNYVTVLYADDILLLVLSATVAYCIQSYYLIVK
jgi:Reverse transcriptase (RNA-dependent DNA polymerase)